ncbi:MAG: hypothetical protein M3Y66_01945, partial [Actinomycetota bacterium]|nr:hypothetical protein [Actinomycetota bacterium]
NLLPLIVVARFGAAHGAVFFVVWMGVVALDLAFVGFGNALVVRLQGAGLHLLRHALSRVLAIFAVPLLGAALAASPLLGLFGDVYARDGHTFLRWVVLGVVFRLVVILVSAIHLGAARPQGMALLQAVTTVAVVALAFLVPKSDVATELATIGIGFVVVHVVAATVAVADLARRR